MAPVPKNHLRTVGHFASLPDEAAIHPEAAALLLDKSAKTVLRDPHLEFVRIGHGLRVRVGSIRRRLAGQTQQLETA